MSKKLVALALLSALSGVASAQSNVTIYGVVDMSYQYINNGSGALNKMDSGALSGSRIGFKGTEDLGGGLKALFVLESGFTADNGAQATPGVLFNRQSFVGLSDTWGLVKAGRLKTVVYANSDTFDPFGDSLAGDSARLFNYSGNRTDNTLSYAYTDTSGLRGEVNYAFGEVAGSVASGRTMSAMLGYKSGPVDLVLTRQNTNTTTVPGTGIKTTLLGGNYNFGILKAFLTYSWNNGNDVTKPQFMNSREALVGLSAPVGKAGTVMTSFIRKTDRLNPDANANQIAFGYTYDLSVRTTLYTSIARLNNDAKVGFGSSGTRLGSGDRFFNAGMRHTF